LKKLFTICLLLLINAVAANAQIKNAGFENINPDSTIQFWAGSCFYSFTLGDSILSNGPILSSTSDAHSGQRAIKLQNNHNVTQNKYYGACLISNTDSAGQPSFINNFPINITPEALVFYYKFDSLVPGDSAEVTVTIGAPDSMMFPGIEIGSGSIKLYQKNAGYVVASVPIIYTQNLAASFAILKVNTFTDNSIPHFGTVLLLDNFSLNATLAIAQNDALKFDMYPNPAHDEINISASNPISEITISSMLGQVVYSARQQNKMKVELNTGKLPDGTYLVHIRHQNGTSSYSKLQIAH
jgi:Secretion system C-terminal sorting domain